jgi:hypothetical protein
MSEVLVLLIEEVGAEGLDSVVGLQVLLHFEQSTFLGRKRTVNFLFGCLCLLP